MISSTALIALSEASKIINQVQISLPVLGSISWPRKLAEDFFARQESHLPEPVYSPIPDSGQLEAIRRARKSAEGDTPLHHWVCRQADTVEATLALLASRGTADFYTHSSQLYGNAQTPIADGAHSALDLAIRIDAMLADIQVEDMGCWTPERLTSHDLKLSLEESLVEYFGAEAPNVIISTDVSAKAVAGKNYIKLREDATFSDLDQVQLLQHEGLVHIGTAKNGSAQALFPILGESHPGNARTQEGLAVFAEFISGAIDPARFRRLADRVIAIDMAAKGADFIELYRFFMSQNPHQPKMEAYESARRIVRGGLVKGGAPFTKDAIYLAGLLDVHSYLRAAVRLGEPRYMHYLFVGKLDLGDLHAIKMLDELGQLVSPRFMPNWVTDMRYLLAYLAYSTFLNQIDLKAVHARFDELFANRETYESPEDSA